MIKDNHNLSLRILKGDKTRELMNCNAEKCFQQNSITF